MPQVKGTVTFLTNLRRQTSERERRVGIDNSDVRIENETIEKQKRQQLDEINVRQYRTLVDRLYELNETKKDCCNYERMKSIAMQTNVETIMEERRKEKEHVFQRLASRDGATEPVARLQPAKLERPTTSVPKSRPTTGGALKPARHGFSHVLIDDSDSDDGDVYRKRSAKETVPSAVALERTTTAYPSRSRRRPKTSHPARSVRQIRQALEKEFSGDSTTRRRPKTTLGFSANDDVPDSYVPGRSFNELKDLTHIDHLNSAQIRARQEELRKIRSKRLAAEQETLQCRLERFYDRLEKFKKDSNRNVLKATPLFEN